MVQAEAADRRKMALRTLCQIDFYEYDAADAGTLKCVCVCSARGQKES
jgi:hypothetical protein